jgi:hypothetical protein
MKKLFHVEAVVHEFVLLETEGNTLEECYDAAKKYALKEISHGCYPDGADVLVEKIESLHELPDPRRKSILERVPINARNSLDTIENLLKEWFPAEMAEINKERTLVRIGDSLYEKIDD